MFRCGSSSSSSEVSAATQTSLGKNFPLKKEKGTLAMNVLHFQSGWSRNLGETKIQFANSFLAIRNKHSLYVKLRKKLAKQCCETKSLRNSDRRNEALSSALHVALRQLLGNPSSLVTDPLHHADSRMFLPLLCWYLLVCFDSWRSRHLVGNIFSSFRKRQIGVHSLLSVLFVL